MYVPIDAQIVMNISKRFHNSLCELSGSVLRAPSEVALITSFGSPLGLCPHRIYATATLQLYMNYKGSRLLPARLYI